MRIERIDDKTVKCFLSNEELEEYDISYKDFVMRSDKAREVVEDIIEQAEEEVGYQPPRFAFDLQIMVVQQGMLLTFSERDAEADTFEKELLDCFRNMKDFFANGAKAGWAGDPRMKAWFEGLARFGGLGKGIAQKQAGEQGYIENHQEQGASESGEQALSGSGEQAASDGGEQAASGSGGQAPEDKRPEFVVFCFSSLRNVCRFAKAVPAELGIKSALYCLEDYYYLYLERGEVPYESYSHACIQALEFSAIFTADPNDTGYLEEHGECLIAQDALRKLGF